jgi:integrase/recombinase XerD
MEEFLMNRSTPGLLISKSIDGFLKFKTAEGLSLRTITSYEFTLNQWLSHISDRNVSEIQASDITGYLAWLRTEYKPVRFNGSTEPLSAKSIRNVWITFRSFFGWLHVEFKYPNPAIEITAPKFQTHPVETFTKEDVEKIMKACVYSRESHTEEKKKFVMRRPSANRDQAIVLTLLDTGLRATELCSLTINMLTSRLERSMSDMVSPVAPRVVRGARSTWEKSLEKLSGATWPAAKTGKIPKRPSSSARPTGRSTRIACGS